MNLKTLFSLAGLAAAGVLSFSNGSAQADPFVEAADTVKYRQQAFSMIRANFGVMADMIRGETKFDAEQFQQHAQAIEKLANIPLDGFKGVGANVTTESAAKPNIWQNWDDFEKKMTQLIKTSAELADVSKTGQVKQIAPKFMATANSCKQCHDNYREK